MVYNIFLLDLLFPKFCVGCGYLGSYLCLSCQKKLVLISNDKCLYCHKNNLFGLTHQACVKKNGVDGVSALYKYNYILQRVLKTLKYRLATEIWKEFSFIASIEAKNKWTKYKPIVDNTILQLIPLNPLRKNNRGFNQALLVAELLPFNFDKKNIINQLIRVKNTHSQAELKTDKQRKTNIQQAFKVTNPLVLKNQRILLVDDVITSGETIKQAARVLKKAGASFVYAICLARG